MSETNASEVLHARLEAGDDQAFGELFCRYRVRLKQMLAFRMDPRLRKRQDASDILQEVFIDAHERIAHYRKRPQLSFFVWLRQLTMQRLIDNYRRHMSAEMRDVRREESIDRRAGSAVSLAMVSASPSQVAIRAEMAVHIERALGTLDLMDQEVLALRHFEELRNNEVAEVLGIKEAAASNRYMRALARLREALAQSPGDVEQA